MPQYTVMPLMESDHYSLYQMSSTSSKDIVIYVHINRDAKNVYSNHKICIFISVTNLKTGNCLDQFTELASVSSKFPTFEIANLLLVNQVWLTEQIGAIEKLII